MFEIIGYITAAMIIGLGFYLFVTWVLLADHRAEEFDNSITEREILKEMILRARKNALKNNHKPVALEIGAKLEYTLYELPAYDAVRDCIFGLSIKRSDKDNTFSVIAEGGKEFSHIEKVNV